MAKIDEVAIFNRALTDGTGNTVTEIAALYDGTGSNIRPSNLIASNLNPSSLLSIRRASAKLWLSFGYRK